MANGNKLLRIVMPGKNLSESEKAYGIGHENTTIWIPKSQIKDFTKQDGGFEFWCPEWLVTEKGLDMYIDTSHEPSLF